MSVLESCTPGIAMCRCNRIDALAALTKGRSSQFKSQADWSSFSAWEESPQASSARPRQRTCGGGRPPSAQRGGRHGVIASRRRRPWEAVPYGPPDRVGLPPVPGAAGGVKKFCPRRSKAFRCSTQLHSRSTRHRDQARGGQFSSSYLVQKKTKAFAFLSFCKATKIGFIFSRLWCFYGLVCT
jgi:hypothetical protein